MNVYVQHPKPEPDSLSVKFNYYIEGGIWPFTVMFTLGYSYDELMKVLEDTGAVGWRRAIDSERDRNTYERSGFLAMFREVTEKKEGEEEHPVQYFFIKIKDQFRFTDWEMCALAHEVVHICQFALPDLLDRDREIEAEAYTHTYIMEACLKKLREVYQDNQYICY
jgi:hypothetical protein